MGVHTPPEASGSAPRARLVVAVLAGALLTACASVKALPETEAAAAVRLRAPTEIYVRPFETNSGKWEGRAARPERRQEITDWLAAGLEKHLREIAPTRLVGEETPSSGWLVTGRFIRVNPGSKFQRMFIGLGAGGSRLETKVSVYDLAVSSSDPIFVFNTTGGSNLQAGPHTIFNSATEDDIERTGREVAEFLKERLLPRERGAPAAYRSDTLEGLEPTPNTRSGSTNPSPAQRGPRQ